MPYFKETYKKLCDHDGYLDELTIDSFIEITTQQFMNLNTERIIAKIKEMDEDDNGLIDFQEFL